jgi:Domain of unknown function (DUF1937)
MTIPRRTVGADEISADRHLPQKRIIYLACPYTDPDPSVRERRFHAATRAAASLIKEGYIVYSPITMTHPIDIVLTGDTTTLGSDYWVNFDQAFMDLCSEIIVLKIGGWDKSSGVQREIRYFKAQGKNISFMSPDQLEMRNSQK